MPKPGSDGLKAGRTSGGFVAAHPATNSDASIARLAIFMIDLKLDGCVRPRRNGFRSLRANASKEASSVYWSWGGLISVA